MYNLKNHIKDLLGKDIQIVFHTPFEDDKNLKYDTRFGLQPDKTIMNGLIISKPQPSPHKLFAAFSGALSFFTVNDYNKKVAGLSLTLLPTDIFFLHSSLEEGSFPPLELIYIPIDKKTVSTQIQALLKKRGFLEKQIQATLKSFMKSEEKIFVLPGDDIGKTDGSKLKLMFAGFNNHIIHPLYLIWSLWNLSQ